MESESVLFQNLVAALRPAATWGYRLNREEWDLQVSTPPAAQERRAADFGELAAIAHRHFTDPRVGECLANLRLHPGLCGLEAFIAGRISESFDRASRLPGEFVERQARTITTANAAWKRAREGNDYSLFAPHLGHVLEVQREMAGYLGATSGDTDSVYTVLLQGFEPGMTTAEVRALRDPLRDWTVQFLGRIMGSRAAHPPALLEGNFPIEQQRLLAETVARLFGYDFQRGCLAEVVHPFCMTCGPDDVRITTHYYPAFLSRGLYAVMHECGHALFEQGAPLEVVEVAGSQMQKSLSIHESQSRLWENIVGRNRRFLAYIAPLLRSHFPQLWAATDDELYRSVNRVQPGPNRIYADEVTYNLHVGARFELELALLSGDLSVVDLPGAWNEKYERYLGIRPANDVEGCLQDIHWSWGTFGYFPTYTLGNLTAVPLWDAYLAQQDDLMAWFGRTINEDDLAGLLKWLRTNVHRFGLVQSLPELTDAVTGRPLTIDPWCRYIEQKFCPLYGLEPATTVATN